MLYAVVILLSYAGSVITTAPQKIYDYEPPFGYDGDPRSLYCCWPGQFKATVLSNGGYPEHVPDVAQIDRTLYYDLPGNRWALKFNVEFFNGEKVESIWMEDHNKKRMVQVRGKKCDYKKLDTESDMKKLCVSDSSRFVEKIRMGAKDEQIGYDVYEWTERAVVLGNVTYHIAVQPRTCLPLMETGWWKEGDYTLTQTLELTDVELTSDVSRYLDSVYERFDCQPAKAEDKRQAMRWVPEPVQRYLRVRFRDVLPEELERSEEYNKKRDEEANKKKEEQKKGAKSE